MTGEAGEWYAVRCVFRWTGAETEAREYAENTGVTYLGFAQGYATGEEDLRSGSEAFSLLRDSSLAPDEYLDRHFDTGEEHQRTL